MVARTSGSTSSLVGIIDVCTTSLIGSSGSDSLDPMITHGWRPTSSNCFRGDGEEEVMGDGGRLWWCGKRMIVMMWVIGGWDVGGGSVECSGWELLEKRVCGGMGGWIEKGNK